MKKAILNLIIAITMIFFTAQIGLAKGPAVNFSRSMKDIDIGKLKLCAYEKSKIASKKVSDAEIKNLLGNLIDHSGPGLVLDNGKVNDDDKV